MADNRCTYLDNNRPNVDPRCRPRPNVGVNLFSDLNEETLVQAVEDDKIMNTHNNEASVFLRLRSPIKESDLYNIDGNIFKTKIIENNIVNHGKERTEKHFTFSKIFNGTTSQVDVYNSCVYSAIENEDNLTLLAYGVSGSGKTHTLLGNTDYPGIIPRAIEQIFTRYEKNISKKSFVKIKNGSIFLIEDSMALHEESQRLKLIKQCSNSADTYYYQYQTIHQEHAFHRNVQSKAVFIWISFAEIYNENVYDLFSSGDIENKENIPSKRRKNLKIISNEGNSFIKGLTTISVTSSEEAYQLLKFGQSHISYATTNINANSSRSHCIFFIDIISCVPSGQFNHSSYRFCDLAGSERLKKTENIGNRLKEAQRINNSLLVLGRCLDVVYNNQLKKRNDLVPIRDSKLTLLLQAALLGKEQITMIVNMLPVKEYFEENLHVLNFSAIANQIVYKINPKRKPSRSSRFSFFQEQIAYINRSSPESYGSSLLSTASNNSLLMDENYRLKNEIELLKANICQIRKQSEEDEINIREKLADDWEKVIKTNKETANKQLARREDVLRRDFKFKMEQIEKKYQKEIAKLKEIQKEMEIEFKNKNPPKLNETA